MNSILHQPATALDFTRQLQQERERRGPALRSDQRRARRTGDRSGQARRPRPRLRWRLAAG